MLCTGALAHHKSDKDLYLVRGGMGTQGRIRLMRWSDGSTRTAFCTDASPLSVEASYHALYEAARKWTRRISVLNNLPYSPHLDIIHELQRCIARSDIYERTYTHDEPGGSHLYRHDFIREYYIKYSWFEVYEEPFITNDHILKRAKAYCSYIGVGLPLDSLIRRRLASYWKSAEMPRVGR